MPLQTTGCRRQDFSFRNKGSAKTVQSSCSDSAVEASKEKKGEESGGSLHQEGAECEEQRAATEQHAVEIESCEGGLASEAEDADDRKL